MIDVLSTALIVATLLAAAWLAVYVALGRWLEVSKRDVLALLALVVVVLIGLIVQAVYGVVAVSTTGRNIESATFVAYLIGTPVVLILAAYWSLTERSRWGPGVLLIGCVAATVMVVRLHQIWGAHG